MCETMTNIPVEKEPPYVLTEDMFDAAMNEQFSYQNDVGSEEELSSPDEVMEVDNTSQESCFAENVGNENPTDEAQTQTLQKNNSNPNHSPPSSPCSNSNKMSVLVIETGLDRSGSGIHSYQKETNFNTSDNCQRDNVSDNVKNATHENESHERSSAITSVVAKESCHGTKSQLPILKQMLSDNQDNEVTNVESIDLCESEPEELSEDEELNNGELIDDELKSVMETNLMAEIGMTVNKATSNNNSSKITNSENSSDRMPKITVKNIAQISSEVFNSLTDLNNSDNTKPVANPENIKANENQVRSSSSTCRNSNHLLNNIISDNKQGPIQINKIAVPHSTFMTSQGQTMKCVVVKNQAALPVVINTTQSHMTNNKLKYIMTPQVKKNPLQISPISALANMTKQNLQPQKLVLSKNASKVITMAQKLQKPPALRNIASRINSQYKYKYDHNLDSLIKSLVFHSLKKPYTPPDPYSDTYKPNYTCVDCNDRFMLQSSLNHHLSRHSISISYWCEICKSELQFYNRCLLLRHLRLHNNSVKLIDTSCITFGPLPKEMVLKGPTEVNFKEFISNYALPPEECILPNCYKNKLQSDDVTKSVPSMTQTSLQNSRITTVAGQSKSVCYQTLNSIKKPISSSLSSQSVKKSLPVLLPKNQKPVQSVALIQSLQNQTKEQSLTASKPPQKSVIFLCNTIKNLNNVKQSGVMTSLPPNVELDSRNINMTPVIDHNGVNPVLENETISTSHVVEERDEAESNENVTTPQSTFEKLNPFKEKKNYQPHKPRAQNRNCTECGLSYFNISKHLNGNNRPVSNDLTCNVCNLILPTKCALKIHQRIHTKSEPFKCPDCGKDFDKWNELYRHLKYSCGHLAKCVRYMCFSCKSHFPSSGMLGLHISQKHSRDIYKCTLCPVAFYTKQSLNKHIRTTHGNEADKSTIGMDYRQCSLCPRKLMPIEKFPSHVQEHTNNNAALIYGFKCPMCSVVYAKQMAFIIHLIKEKRQREEASKTIEVESLSLNSPTIDSNNDSKQETIQLSDSNSDIEFEKEIMVSGYPEIDDLQPSEKDPLSLDDWECNQEVKVKEKTEELCIVCKKNFVVLLPGIDLNSQSLCCNQCVKRVDGDNPDIINSNIKETKNMTNNSSKSQINISKSSPIRTVYRSSSVDNSKIAQKKRRISDVSLTSSQENGYSSEHFNDGPQKKRIRKRSNKRKVIPKGQVITSKPFGELVCSKCQFVAETREIFCEHIIGHRTDPNTYQCLECGMCFVVLPSLERHLQMHHGITDINNYIASNGSCLPQKPVAIEEDTDGNQCRVCYQVFDSCSSLEKHFRTHGMAFMNSLSKSP